MSVVVVDKSDNAMNLIDAFSSKEHPDTFDRCRWVVYTINEQKCGQKS
jgi:hypothetical protein